MSTGLNRLSLPPTQVTEDKASVTGPGEGPNTQIQSQHCQMGPSRAPTDMGIPSTWLQHDLQVTIQAAQQRRTPQ
jgi:hypothetical protein